MLGQSSNPVIIQMHLRKLFQAIHDVKFLKVANGISITDFCSREGESVPIKKTVLVENEVEKWLNELEKEMHSTLAIMFSDCLADCGELGGYPGQILALRESVRFSEKVEKAIKTGKLPLLLRELQVCGPILCVHVELSEVEVYTRSSLQILRPIVWISTMENADFMNSFSGQIEGNVEPK